MTSQTQQKVLGEIVALQTEKVVANKDRRMPYIGLEHIAPGGSRLIGSAASDTSISVNSVFQKDDILFGKLRPNLRKSVRAPFSGYCSTDILVLRCIPGVAPGFASRVFQWDRVFDAAAATAAGTKMPRTSWGDLKCFQLFVPESIEEQERIACVLDKIDYEIFRTEAAIDKLKQIRTGLLYDLLTCGLDENGDLRDPIINPEKFKDSSLGKIPREWNTCSIEQLLAPTANPLRSGPFGSALLKSELRPEGIPFLGIDNVHVEHFNGNFTRFVGEEKYQELVRYAVRPSDIMITVMGTVGRCCVVPDDIGRALSSKHVWTVSLDLERYSPLLACWQINHAPWVIRQLRRDEQGGVMKAIRSETLRAITLPIPSREELAAIESVLINTMATIAREESELDKLRLIKSALMSDLLTGCVRVPQDLELD